eukprot:scaffold257809_cov18-Tisochrysis_lutea.AAC.2
MRGSTQCTRPSSSLIATQQIAMDTMMIYYKYKSLLANLCKNKLLALTRQPYYSTYTVNYSIKQDH